MAVSSVITNWDIDDSKELMISDDIDILMFIGMHRIQP